MSLPPQGRTGTAAAAALSSCDKSLCGLRAPLLHAALAWLGRRWVGRQGSRSEDRVAVFSMTSSGADYTSDVTGRHL